MYLPRLLALAPPSLAALAAANARDPRSWASQALSDLDWLQRVSPKVRSLPSATVSLGPWIDLVSSYPRAWKQIVSSATSKHHVVQSLPQQPPEQFFRCYECGRDFGSKAALSMHAYRVHGYTSPAKRYAPGSSCICCMKEFWTRPRLLHHLSCNSKRCLERIMLAVAPIPEGLREELDRADALHCKNARASGEHVLLAHRPAVQLYGPSLVPHG